MTFIQEQSIINNHKTLAMIAQEVETEESEYPLNISLLQYLICIIIDSVNIA